MTVLDLPRPSHRQDELLAAYGSERWGEDAQRFDSRSARLGVAVIGLLPPNLPGSRRLAGVSA